MTLQTNDPSSQLILRRIDTIIAELQTLRQQVLTIQAPEVAAANLVEELAGSLSQGNWDESDPDLDWKRCDR